VRYLLDTNVVIGLLKGTPPLSARIRRHSPDEFGLPAVAVHELFYGAFKSHRRAHNLARVHALRFEVVSFDLEDALHAGEVRASLASAGTPIGPYDVLIAGQARARKLVLLTRNTRELARVPGLFVDNWEGE
jgi:tRNA(fMet)-specific endonuclease VapC